MSNKNKSNFTRVMISTVFFNRITLINQDSGRLSDFHINRRIVDHHQRQEFFSFLTFFPPSS